jgi:lysophospholipid acyltransferase (LPLAT)-like uncharacterized protein
MALRNRLLRSILIPLGAVLLRLHARTLRLRIEGEAPLRAHLAAGGRLLLCSWHQRFYAGILGVRHLEPAIAISRSRDGEGITRMVEKLGWTPVRGSSSRGGVAALRGMIDAVSAGRVGVHIVDGPRGPARRLKPGLLRIAQRARAPIACGYVGYARAWEARSWDRFQIPLPFTRVLLRFGRMIEVPEQLEGPAFDELLAEIEAELERGYEKVDAEVRA